MKLQNPKGTYDLFDMSARHHAKVRRLFFESARVFGFSEVITPIFESKEVFIHTLGEQTDVVQKEMFSLSGGKDSGREYVLRPENTAGVMRMVLQNGLQQSLPKMLAYCGPMFRYERPQKGRFRQFYQLGVEALGDSSWLCDVDNILLANHFLKNVGIRNVELHVNFLGGEDERASYQEALFAFFKEHETLLSGDSRSRLYSNVLRILDSKSESDLRILEKAPAFSSYLNPESKSKWTLIKNTLTNLQVSFVENQRLVRGLDYYNDLVFEVVSPSYGRQNALIGGGRYDKLSCLLGARDKIPSVGWAAGMERIINEMPEESDQAGSCCQVMVVPLSESLVEQSFLIASTLREKMWSALLFTHMVLKKALTLASKINVNFVIIVGEKEEQEGSVTVRCLSSGAQETIPKDSLLKYLERTHAAKSK